MTGAIVWCPYCDLEVEIAHVTDLAQAIQDGRDRTGWYLLTHWPTPTAAHQWSTQDFTGEPEQS